MSIYAINGVQLHINPFIWYQLSRWRLVGPVSEEIQPNLASLKSRWINCRPGKEKLCSFYYSQVCFYNISPFLSSIFVSIVVSIPACHAGDRGSIPRQRVNLFIHMTYIIYTYSKIISFLIALKMILEYVMYVMCS